MKKIPLIFFLGAVAALALSVGLPDPHEKIALSQTFAKKLERAKHIDTDTERTIAGLIASIRAYGPQDDPIWENRRLDAIKRLEAMLPIEASASKR